MKYCCNEDDVFYHIVKTNTKTKTKTKTKCIEDPTYAVFSKSREFKDINYDQTRPDQTRPDQTRPDQTRPDQTRPDHIFFGLRLMIFCTFIP